MSTSQETNHDHKEEEEKTDNSLFQTELSNPKISSDQPDDKIESNEKDKQTKHAEENNIDNLAEKEANANHEINEEKKDDNQEINEEKKGNNQEMNEEKEDDNQKVKIDTDIIKDTINISFGDDDSKENENNCSQKAYSPSQNEKNSNQSDQNTDSIDISASINYQLNKKYGAFKKSRNNDNRARTSISNRNKNKKYSYVQGINTIPDSIKYNKYVESHYELYTGNQKAAKIPRAAMSKKDYNAKEATQLDELTLKLLDGDEDVIKKIKNSRKINPNLNTTSKTSKPNQLQKNNNNENNLANSMKENGNNNDTNDVSNNGIEQESVIIDNKDGNGQEESKNYNEDLVTEENNEYKNNVEDDTNYLADDDLPTLDDLKKTASQLRNFEREMISKGKYSDAKNASLTLKMVNKEIYKQQNFAKNKGTIEELVSKRNELKALLNSTTEEFDNMIIDHEQNTISKLDQIALQQQQELEDFDKNIPNDLPPLFKRNSVSYLKMRSKEKYLAINRNFDEAMILQKKANVIEKEEEQLNFEKMDQYYRDQKKKLIIKQKNAIENYIQYADMRKGEILNLREVAIRGTTNRIKNLEYQIRIECGKRGIKQSEINYDIVDDARIELIKSKENENPISYKRAATSKSQRNGQATLTATTSASLSPSHLSTKSSVTNSQSSLASASSQSKRKSSLSTNKPKIKTPSSLSNLPLSSSVGSKRPNKPTKTHVKNSQNGIKEIPKLNQNTQAQPNQENEIEKEKPGHIENNNQKAEIGVNTKLEDTLNDTIQTLNSKINEETPKED